MTTSLEAAFDLFSKWKQDSLKVRVDLTAGKPGLPDNPLTIRAHLTGSVIAVDPSNAPGTVTVQGNHCGLELAYSVCSHWRIVSNLTRWVGWHAPLSAHTPCLTAHPAARSRTNCARCAR